jgi:hypothetical protein
MQHLGLSGTREGGDKMGMWAFCSSIDKPLPRSSFYNRRNPNFFVYRPPLPPPHFPTPSFVIFVSFRRHACQLPRGRSVSAGSEPVIRLSATPHLYLLKHAALRC